MQFAQLAKKIAELETAEMHRSAQLQPLIQGKGTQLACAWEPVTKTADILTDGMVCLYLSAPNKL